MESTPELKRLELEVQLEEQPIRGRLYDRDAGGGRSFSGWLGLVSAIEAAGQEDASARQQPGGEGR